MRKQLMFTKEQKQQILELAWDLARTNLLYERYGLGAEEHRHRELVRQAEANLKAYLDKEQAMDNG